MIRNIFFISLLFVLIGCKPNHDKVLEKMILGEWKVVKVIDIKKTKDPNEPPPPPILYKI